jgi:hypothetical protein
MALRNLGMARSKPHCIDGILKGVVDLRSCCRFVSIRAGAAAARAHRAANMRYRLRCPGCIIKVARQRA